MINFNVAASLYPTNIAEYSLQLLTLLLEPKIALLRRKKDISDVFNVKIGDDFTKQNQELLNRLHLHEKITSAWFFNGHVFGTDEKGARHQFDIYDNIDEKLK